MTTNSPPYRLLPSIDRLLRLQDPVPPNLAREAARRLVAELREEMRAAWPPPEGEDAAMADETLRARLAALRAAIAKPFHRRVLNATGILLHTGLGRAPLADAAIEAMAGVARQGYVEVEPESGKRGRRETRVAAHICALTGAEAATVVNNNAAATLLALDATARGGDVAVSRGELVEIGGGFRMPDVMRQAGCRLVEVGATNRTRLADYSAAITAETRCLLKVHPSNFRIEGFTEDVALADLVALGREHGIPVVEDLGSGWLLEEPMPHDAREPGVVASIATGADLVCFSGDKLLGACQAGILAGKRDSVARAARHPLYRAMRCSKLELAALEATLMIYRYGEPKRDIPVLRSIFADVEGLTRRAEHLATRVRSSAEALGYAVAAGASEAYMGSGASPARAIESAAVYLEPRDARFGIEAAAMRLRLGEPAVFARIDANRIVFDLRSLAPLEDEELAVALGTIANETE